MKPTNQDIYQVITNKIIEGLEKGIVPWKSGIKNPVFSTPTNLLTKKNYSGINVILLSLVEIEKEYKYSLWGTFRQIQNLGGKVLSGEKSTNVVYTNFIVRHKKSKEKISFEDYKQLEKVEKKEYQVSKFLRFHKVFNIDFGSETYSQEELIAEIGSCFLIAKAGIKNDYFENSIAYINGWISALKNDKKLILTASSNAQKAVKYILDN